MPKKFKQELKKEQVESPTNKIRKKNQKLGRPQQKINQDIEQQNSILQKYWFGDEKATQLITYFIQQGNLIVKCKTGIPASKDKEQACVLFNMQREQLNIKPFRKRYIRELKLKISNILQYFGYNQQCLLLSKNDEYQNSKGSFLTSILQFLDPKFIKSYFQLISCYEFCQEQYFSKEQYVELFYNEIRNDQESHKMLLDLQAIKYLLKDDFDLLEQIKDHTKILSVLELAKTKYRIPSCDLTSNEIRMLMDQGIRLWIL
ncbi:hypothetical protein pb186bvf_017443 [Paramecium bursaria]